MKSNQKLASRGPLLIDSFDFTKERREEKKRNQTALRHQASNANKINNQFDELIDWLLFGLAWLAAHCFIHQQIIPFNSISFHNLFCSFSNRPSLKIKDF